MNPTVDQLLQAALLLPYEEQRELVAALSDAIDGRGSLPFDESWVREAKRRSDEYDAGGVQTIPWEEVKEAGRRLTPSG